MVSTTETKVEIRVQKPGCCRSRACGRCHHSNTQRQVDLNEAATRQTLRVVGFGRATAMPPISLQARSAFPQLRHRIA